MKKVNCMYSPWSSAKLKYWETERKERKRESDERTDRKKKKWEKREEEKNGGIGTKKVKWIACTVLEAGRRRKTANERENVRNSDERKRETEKLVQERICGEEESGRSRCLKTGKRKMIMKRRWRWKHDEEETTGKEANTKSGWWRQRWKRVETTTRAIVIQTQRRKECETGEKDFEMERERRWSETKGKNTKGNDHRKRMHSAGSYPPKSSPSWSVVSSTLLPSSFYRFSLRFSPQSFPRFPLLSSVMLVSPWSSLEPKAMERTVPTKINMVKRASNTMRRSFKKQGAITIFTTCNTTAQ